MDEPEFTGPLRWSWVRLSLFGNKVLETQWSQLYSRKKLKAGKANIRSGHVTVNSEGTCCSWRGLQLQWNADPVQVVHILMDRV